MIYFIVNILFNIFVDRISKNEGQIQKFSSLGRVPTKAIPGSACYNVYSLRDITIRPGGTEKIPIVTGFKFSKKYVCRAYPRSSMSVLPTFLGGGVIDSDYRGNICIILTNFAACSIDIEIGDRIAEIMFLKPEKVSFDEVKEFEMATDINDGVPSKAIEEIIFKNMMKIMLEKFNE